MNKEQEAYIRTTEIAFDNAIYRGDLILAQKMITQLNNGIYAAIRKGELAEDASRLIIKELAFPMYLRAGEDMKGVEYTDRQEDISALYGQAVELMAFFWNWHSSVSPTERDPAILATDSQIVGLMSELTVFALVARTATGEDSDPYTIWPASQADDFGYYHGGPKAEARGFDFVLQTRDTFNAARLQVKTTKTDKIYAEGIVIINLTEVAGPGYMSRERLQEALMSEVAGRATPEQIQHINESFGCLEEKARPVLQQGATQISA